MVISFVIGVDVVGRSAVVVQEGMGPKCAWSEFAGERVLGAWMRFWCSYTCMFATTAFLFSFLLLGYAL